ncbi:MAG: TonB-dependent receptor plug domain-containing protein [Allosphingosinicella sp.]|uniref:TonB-dependent receptor n=1 Tax=Allosphingosinicella sp. TaxID=2823234 RepID=UPI00393B623D
MTLTRPFLFGLAAAGLPFFPLSAAELQPVSPDPVEEAERDLANEEAGTIIVTAARLRGAVVSNIPPEIQLGEEEIQALGASSLAELLQALSPQTASARGRGGERPVILLNGRRISGFSEIRNLPPEAIERVDILAEEVALRYGYRADQRVVNFVLKENFQAVTAEVQAGAATAGGRGSYAADLGIVQIQGTGRWNVDFEYRQDSFLFESERDLIQGAPARPFDLVGNVTAPVAGAEIDPALSAVAGRPVTVAPVPTGAANAAPGLAAFAGDPRATDLGPFRTLLPATRQMSLGGAVNRMVTEAISGTLTARISHNDSESRFGLPSATLTLPAGNPFSPFAGDVLLNRYFDAPRPLTRESSTQSGQIGLALNGTAAPWRWSFTGNYERASNRTGTDRGIDLGGVQERLNLNDPALNPFGALPPGLLFVGGRDRAWTDTETASAEATASGPLLTLPAGPLTASFQAGLSHRGLDSRTERRGIAEERELSRRRANAQASLDLPIASRRENVLAGIGNLSLNVNAAVEHLSDFGTLRVLGGGVNWSPIEALSFIVSLTDEDGAPTMQQLGDPTLATPNVRVFDLLRGETVDITRIDGGNPGLLADNRRVFRINATGRPLGGRDLTLSANYTRTRTLNPIASFPTATPEIEAAFPERFARGADGRLLQIDSRPLNFARSDREELRWGVNFSRQIGSPPALPQRGPGGGGWRGAGGGGGAPAEGRRPRGEGGAEGEAPRQRPPHAEGEAPRQRPPATDGEAPRERPAGARPGGGGGGFGGMMGGRGGGGTRLQLALYHDWRFRDEILIRDGLPPLNLLGGSAVGNRGGRPRHELEFQGGIFHRGLGARITANWQQGTFVRGGPDGFGGTRGDLFFSDLATVNLRLFANLGEQRALVARAPFLANSRLTLSVDNLFDARPRVTDAAGTTPLGYQPAYLDPLGRSVRIGFRKQFF